MVLKKLWLLLLLACIVSFVKCQKGGSFEDNEFAEFEDGGEVQADFDGDASDPVSSEDFEPPEPTVNSGKDEKEIPVAEEEDEEEEEEDDEDLIMEDDANEDFDDLFETEPKAEQANKPPQAPTPPPKIEIVSIPHHLRTNWDSFVIEMLMCGGLLVYFINFFIGKSKNYKLATAWLNSQRNIFESNFSIVGDDGSGTEVNSGILMKESENVYSLWCSGRTCVEGMLCELKFLKRQCLVATLANIMRPGKSDQLLIRAKFNKDDMDTFVMAVGNKKSVTKMSKDLNDLNTFCSEKKNGEKIGLTTNFAILSEISEATSAVLDNKVVAVLAKYEDMVDSIHITDQFSGTKASTDDNAAKPNPVEVSKEIRCIFNVPGKGKPKPEDMESLKSMLQLVFHLIDKVKRIRLSKDSKKKADQNRTKIEESLSKLSHTQRQEQAQQRREEKRRVDKEKMMNEEDPDKQRRWEEKEYKRDMKKKQPRVKQMKMKAM